MAPTSRKNIFRDAQLIHLVKVIRSLQTVDNYIIVVESAPQKIFAAAHMFFVLCFSSCAVLQARPSRLRLPLRLHLLPATLACIDHDNVVFAAALLRSSGGVLLGPTESLPCPSAFAKA